VSLGTRPKGEWVGARATPVRVGGRERGRGDHDVSGAIDHDKPTEGLSVEIIDLRAELKREFHLN
jgi:hypothetical protein